MHFDTPQPIQPAHLHGQKLDFSPSGMLALSRLAALQGQAVSRREFEQLAQSLDSETLRGVPMASQIATLWFARFPLGAVRAPSWPPKPSDIPLLWLGPAEAQGSLPVRVVLGAQANGGLRYLDDSCRSRVLHPEQAHQGRLLVLDCYPRTNSATVIEQLALAENSDSTGRNLRHLLVLIGLLILTLIAWLLGRD